MRPKIPASYIAEQAARYIRRAGTRDPEEICRSLGICVLEHDLQRKIKAYYFYQSRISCIVLDTHVSEVFRRVLLAHELGHHALHRKIAVSKGFRELEVLEKREGAPMESEANLFAAELLLEDDHVLSLLNEYTFFEAAAILGVPASLLDFKCSMLQHKGYALRGPDIGRADFLKADAGAFSPS